jgi:hypothetical protein
MTNTDETKRSLRRRTLFASAIAAIGLAGAACAHVGPVEPGLADLRVVDRETGEVLQTWRHHGRLFVAGEPGARYSLRVTNHTDGRVLVVMSVDGINILTGQTASPGQRGYVLGPYGAYDVTGWRKSNSEVAAFAFAPLPQSYAARTGRPNDVGVIGMAVFRERAPVEAEAQRAYAPPPPAPPPSDMSSARGVAPNRLAGAFMDRPEAEKLGTAHGAREWSVVSDTAFERATPYPQSVRQIEYDTYAHLLASGVIPPSPYAQRRPRPFPASPDGGGFVPDPPIDP